MKVLITGAAGFIGGYLCEELLGEGWDVVGLDNYSKYGKIERAYDKHERYHFVEGDAKDTALVTELLADCDHFVAGAAMIGGITYFHEYAYDLLAENERITASSFDAAIQAHRDGKLQRITALSSSMVFENGTQFPTPETHVAECPAPTSTYGFQKLAVEYFCKGAFEQYGLPYTICRPFNCVGIGERRALGGEEIMSGNVKLAMSHVVPDIAQKVMRGQDPLRILGDGRQVRCYTYGGDLARGIRIAMTHPDSIGGAFNLSTPVSTTVLELAELIWTKVHGDAKPFRYESDPPYPHDVQHRVPDCRRAKEVLGFEASTSLSEMLDEVLPWIRAEIDAGRL